MRRTLLRILALWSFAFPGHAVADSSPAVCSLEQMQIDPASVIDPCSAVIADNRILGDRKAEAYHVRGRGYGRTARLKEAAQDYDVAIKLAPTRSDIYVSRSNVEGKLGKFSESWADLERALSINPREARAYRDMGMMYSGAGQYDEALKLFSRVLSIDPGEPYSRLERSRIAFAQHRVDDALADASFLVDVPSETINKLGYVDNRGVLLNFHAFVLTHRASLYQAIGDATKAFKDLDSALAEKRSADTLVTRSQYLMYAGRDDDALKDADEAVGLDPTSGETQYQRGIMLARLHRYEDGLSSFDTALAIHRKLVVSAYQIGSDLLMRAKMLRALARTDEAVMAVNEAIDASRDVQSDVTEALSRAGYWTQGGISGSGTPAFQSAVRACMIDKDCN